MIKCQITATQSNHPNSKLTLFKEDNHDKENEDDIDDDDVENDNCKCRACPYPCPHLHMSHSQMLGKFEFCEFGMKSHCMP